MNDTRSATRSPARVGTIHGQERMQVLTFLSTNTTCITCDEPGDRRPSHLPAMSKRDGASMLHVQIQQYTKMDVHFI
jgi:hypothetical protein